MAYAWEILTWVDLEKTKIPYIVISCVHVGLSIFLNLIYLGLQLYFLRAAFIGMSGSDT